MKLASRGLRDMDTGPEAVSDPGELAAVRRQAARVWRRTLALALLLTMLALAVP